MKAKQLLLFSLLVLGPASGRADERSAELLGRLRAKVRTMSSYRLDFTATVEGGGTMQGRLTVSGQRFAAQVQGQELYCDGTTLWNYTPQQHEVTVERLDPKSSSLFSNPSKLLNIDPADYTHRSLPEVSDPKGKRLAVVELTPKARMEDVSTLTLYIDPATSLPERIAIASPAAAEPVELTLQGMQSPVPVSESTFRFDVKAHPGVEVIDFR